MKDTLKDSDFIKTGYDNLYGKVYLAGMAGEINVLNFIILLIIFFTLLVHAVPNPKRIDLTSAFLLVNNIRTIVTIFICLAIYTRVRYIYKTSQPWKYGLEYSIYFWGSICLLATSLIFVVIYMTEYLYEGNYLFFNLALFLLVIFVIGYLVSFWRRGDVERTTVASATKKVGSLTKIQTLASLLGAIIMFITFPNEETIFYVSALFLILCCAACFSALICDVYCLFYKEGIDLGIFYQFMDHMDPSKNYPPYFWYPPNFWNKRKRTRVK